ncbi:MAG: hypothetical protein M1830_000904 [Pleopsidium flavum]|nr:MAG: hypothetical protein M1830_000904 [Pleopsidium flavum]
MADPLSITAGIIAVLQLTTTAVQYLNDVKDAPTDRQQILIEISTVSGFLHTLKDLAERMQPGDTHLTALRSLNAPNGPLEQFKSALERLVSKLKPGHGLRKVATALTWTLNKGEVNSILLKIERLKGIFVLALQNDHIGLSRAMNEDIVEIKRGVEELKMTQRSTQHSSALRWLSSTDPSSNHKTACKKHEPTTGDWFLRSDDFEMWKNGMNNFLWLHGKAGCGKTILCSTIIEAVQLHTAALSGVAIAYFYFDFNDQDKQRIKEFLCSIIAQLSQSNARAAERVQGLYGRCQNGGQQPSVDSLQVCLREILEESPRTFLVLDALDECTQREELLDLTKEIHGWKLSNLNVLATSRRELELEEVLSPLSTCMISIQSASVDRDIRLYIDNRLHSDTKLKRWSKHADLMKEIETTLANGADGMFRWVVCQLDALQKCLKIDAVRKTLKTLPRTLDETYERILKSIDEDYQDEAFLALQWLAFSARPMRLEEIAEAVSMAGKEPPVYDPENRLSDPTDVLTICSSLVTLTTRKGERNLHEPEEVNELRLAHFSVKEYLISQRITGRFRIEEILANLAIAKACLTYLLYFDFEMVFKEVLDEYPLLRYAAQFWPEHVRAMPEDSSEPSLDSLVLRLLGSNEVHCLNWQKIYPHRETPYASVDSEFYPSTKGLASLLYYSSFFNLSKLTSSLISSGMDVNTQGERFGNALQAAACQGNETIVQLLLAAEADVNAQGGRYGNALQAAASHGNETIVQLLLAAGADVNAQGGLYNSALQPAAARGNVIIVQLLLTAEADVNAQGGQYGNALQAAAAGRKKTIVQLLLAAGADVNAQGGWYGNALQAAAVERSETIVQLLLAAEADVNTQGGYYGNALQAAAVAGNEIIVQLLLAAGADINAEDRGYGSALQAAALRGNETIVQLLLAAGADINAQGGHWGSALQAAKTEGREAVVQILLAAGAVDHTQRLYRPPLQSTLTLE